MQLEEKQVVLRKLTASEGKIIVSKAKKKDGTPQAKGKIVYLAANASEDDFEEIDEA